MGPVAEGADGAESPCGGTVLGRVFSEDDGVAARIDADPRFELLRGEPRNRTLIGKYTA